MKKIILAIVFSLIFITSVSAHPAKSVNLAIVGADLEISVSHPVRDLSQHYIDQITIKINDEIFKEEFFVSQTDNDFKVLIPLSAEVKVGDVISIVTNCNKGGKKSAALTVSDQIVFSVEEP